MDDPQIDINTTNINGVTPFQTVCEYNRIDIVKLLLGDDRTIVRSNVKRGTTSAKHGV